MSFRDRIVELRRVLAADLRPHPRNWRTHPAAQRAALAGVLSEVGYADALLARQLEDGSLELIDGHLRAELTPEQVVPVLVLDVTAAEADKLLATLDPLAAMAQADEALLADVLSSVTTGSAAVQSLLDDVAARHGVVLPMQELPAEVPIRESYQVVAECESEAAQRELFERLRGEGYRCRLLAI
jgi:hypothetical protein